MVAMQRSACAVVMSWAQCRVICEDVVSFAVLLAFDFMA